MIVFGCSVALIEPWERWAGPGIMRALDDDSELLTLAAMDSISRSNNLLLDTVAGLDGLEALVLVHPHTEIADPQLCAKVRAALADPEVAVVGCIGSTGEPGLAWWEGDVTRGSVTLAYDDEGGGEIPAFGFASPSGPGPAHTVDGFLMVLSSWAVRNIRFDERLTLGHGLDVDYCHQVRAAGRKVVTADFHVIEHRSLELIEDVELWGQAHIALARKWERGLPEPFATPAGGVGEIKARARRAEAEAECARTIAYFRRLGYDARVEALERQLAELTESPSWRLTEPLRRLNMWRRRRADRA